LELTIYPKAGRNPRRWLVIGASGHDVPPGPRRADAVAPATVTEGETPMKIKVMTVHVDDQEKALRFYTNVLGFVKKADFSNGPYRWLTVASAEDPDGTELQLARNGDPAVKAYQQAMFQQGQPAAMFFTDDVQADYERMKARGAEFTMPPTDVTASKIATLNDSCGNLIQVTQLMRY
jgi:predicted enzyme related to lactoylglutathione lyase